MFLVRINNYSFKGSFMQEMVVREAVLRFGFGLNEVVCIQMIQEEKMVDPEFGIQRLMW